MENHEHGGMRRYYGKTFLIGLGFFTMGLMDILYDAYVPIFLRDFISLKSVIGTVMTLDNIFALFLIPIVAAISDRTRTPIGRRIPFILVTLPLSALFFASIPFAAAKGLALLILILFMLNVFKQSGRGPVVALMPDTIPGEYRSEANGVINTMGGLGAIIGTVGLARLMDLSIDLPLIGNTERKLPFLIAGVLVIVSVILLFLFIKERHHDEKAEKNEPIIGSLKLILASKDRSAVLVLVSLLAWFFGYQGLLPFLTMYSVDFMGVSLGTAALAQGSVAVAYAVFAIPSGMIAHRIGRKRTIRISLIGAGAVCLLIFLHHPITSGLGMSGGPAFVVFCAVLFFFGIFWAAIITNSFPMLWQMATYDNMGIYTGLYYFFSQAAAILSPPVTGGISDLAGLRSLFVFTAACFVTAFIIMGFVTKGEAVDTMENGNRNDA